MGVKATSSKRSKTTAGSGERDYRALWFGIPFILSFLAGIFLIVREPAGAGGRMARRGGSLDFRQAGIAVLDLKGVIRFGRTRSLGSSLEGCESMVEVIRKLGENPQVRGLVLRINSPGGTIAATQEIYRALKRFRSLGKPVVAQMQDVAASGGYYVACAADHIVAAPGTLTGSIGVIMRSPELKGLYDWARIRWNVFTSGRYKDIMSPLREMREDERKLLTAIVEDAYKQFYDAVLKARTIKRDRLNQLAQGQIFSGNQAQQEKLVDSLGDFETALAKAGEMAGIRGRPHPLYIRPGYSLPDLFRLLSSLAQGGTLPVQGERSLPGYVRISYLYRGY